MADKRKFLDVWILESNTVYREVPFTVVTDWVQQGRLLAEDKLRPAGTNQWISLGESPAIAVYLPKAEPYRVEDKAEALEPVHVDFAWKRPHGDDDDDVDMIPLIDISLVLLIFFMMTAAVGGAAAFFDTPPAEHKLLDADANLLWVGIKKKGDDVVYSRGKGEGPEEKDYGTNHDAMMADLKTYLAAQPEAIDVNIKAEKDLPFSLVRDMTIELEQLRPRYVARIYGGVSEKEK